MLSNAPFPQAAFDSAVLSSSTNAIVLIAPQSFANVLLLRSSLVAGRQLQRELLEQRLRH
jgi:hypothetical protein